MSIQIIVFVPPGADHPTATRWSTEAQRHGFELTMAPAFDAGTHAGSLPLVCEQLEASVEFSNDSITEYLDEVGRDFVVDSASSSTVARAVGFVTHSCQDDWRASVIAAAAYASATEGALLESRRWHDPC